MSENYKRYLKRIKRENILVFTTQLLILAIFILIWQFISDSKVIDSFLISSPKKILYTTINLIKTNNFFNHIFTTIYEIIISFIFGNIIGLFISTILWFNKFLSRVFEPFLTILNSLPKVAFGPLIIIVFGANINSIIVMALLISSIICIINIHNSFKNTDESKIKIVKSMGANKFQIFYYVVLKNNYINIIQSMKIELSLCFVGVITGELLVSKQGIGYLIMYGSQVFNMNLVLTGIGLLIILTILLYIVVNSIEKASKK